MNELQTPDFRLQALVFRVSLRTLGLLCVLCVDLFILCFSIVYTYAAEEEIIHIRSADYLKYNKDSKITILEGSVQLEYRDTSIIADRAQLDEKSKTVQARGRIVLRDEKNEIKGDFLFYNYDSEYFEINSPSGTTTSPKVEGKVYYWGKTGRGTRKKIKIYDGEITTCGPHCSREYHAKAKEITVFPENKVIARSAYFFIGSVPVLYMPLYVIPLKEEQVQYLEYGYNETDGLFVKSKYPYMAKELITGYLLLNFMAERGTELGTEHDYTSKRLGGTGKQSFLHSNDKLTGRSENNFQLLQNFTAGKTTKGSFQFNRISSLSRETTTTNTNTFNLNLSLNPTPSLSQNLTFQYNLQHIPAESQNTTLNYQQNYLWKKFTTLTTLNYTAFGTDVQPTDKEARLDFSMTRTYPAFQFVAKTSKEFDLDKESYTFDNNKSIQFTLPEVQLAFNTNHIIQHTPWLAFLPLTNLNITYGKYTDGTRIKRRRVSRTSLDMKASRSFNIGKKATITPSHQFTQSLYSTTDAMYVFQNLINFNYNFTPVHRLSIMYNSIKDSGGVPITRDRRSESSLLNANFNITKPKTTLTVTTTYNYKAQTNRYSPLNYSYTRKITQNSGFILASSYDLNEDTFASTNTQLTLKRKNFKADLTAIWNTEDMILNTALMRFEIGRTNGWSFKLQATYDGINPQTLPPLRDIVVVKQNCCTEVQMAYYTDRSEFIFHYVILALPSKPVGFTSGDKGMELDESIFQTQ